MALMLDRERAGREASPSVGIMDSQSIKAPQAKTRGYDGSKKACSREGGDLGRKRHVAVAQTILSAIRKRWPWVKHFFADCAYDRTELMDKARFLDFVVEVVRRTDKDPGFKVVPRRSVVERSFGWLVRWRRLVRDYEERLDVSEAFIHVAMGSLLLLRRVSH